MEITIYRSEEEDDRFFSTSDGKILLSSSFAPNFGLETISKRHYRLTNMVGGKAYSDQVLIEK